MLEIINLWKLDALWPNKNPIHEQQQPQAQKFTIENGDP